MLFENIAPVRDAIRRALTELDEPWLAGHVFQLSLCEGDIVFEIVANARIDADDVFERRISTGPQPANVRALRPGGAA
ncbi:hypothetical protein GCM10009836_69040 [Pseudonocardia ailaonensis]|uniref:Uncharacterized protein n=1 Tax=Pseudonocardia ailaonensis TaxID=367279 RepID=A0ABN2NP33_9PSEU